MKNHILGGKFRTEKAGGGRIVDSVALSGGDGKHLSYRAKAAKKLGGKK